MDGFVDFITDPDLYPSKTGAAPGAETVMMRVNHVYRTLGYLHTYLGISCEDLTLERIVVFCPIKTAKRKASNFDDVRRIEQDAEIAAEETLEIARSCLRGLRKHRQISPGSEVLFLESWIAVAKWLYHKETNTLQFKNYEDVPVITLLREEFCKAKLKAEKADPVIDESLKWLDWPDFLAFVRQLERECLPNYKGGTKRSEKAIAASYQRYLIAAILAYLPPDRQRTLRELQQGKTLVKGFLRQAGNNVWIEESDDGLWYIHLGEGDYKTFQSYGEQFHLVPDILYPYLEAWLNKWRAVLNPQHSFVFTQKDGKPYSTASSLLSVFKRAAYRITGQATTPHLVRHMIITHLKQQGASDAVMQSLAAAMHHSEKAQRKYYDRRNSYEQGSQAHEVMLQVALHCSSTTLSPRLQ